MTRSHARPFSFSATPILVALAACSSPMSEEESADEVRSSKYVPALVACTNLTGAKENGPDGEVKSLAVTSDHGTSFAEIEDWTLLPGFPSTLLRNTSYPIKRSSYQGTKLTFEGGNITLSDAPTGALNGALLLGTKSTQLDCQPQRLLCRSPRKSNRPYVRRLALQVARVVEDLQEKDTGVSIDLIARIPPLGLPNLDAEGTFTMVDTKGNLAATHAKASDPNVGDLVVAWDAVKKARVGHLVFSKAFAAKYEVSTVPPEGVEVVCELSEIPDEAEPVDPPMP